MQQEKVGLDVIKLVGVTCRTNNADEMSPETSKIGPLFGTYLEEQVSEAFQARVNPGVTFAVYTDFETDETGEYTYFVGEEVSTLDGQDIENFATLTIPKSEYQKFTTKTGQFPDVLIDAWETIWKMDSVDFGGRRKYIADFEVYDGRAVDPSNAAVDIYIGVDF